jgi:hypothetical protein
MRNFFVARIAIRRNPRGFLCLACLKTALFLRFFALFPRLIKAIGLATA